MLNGGPDVYLYCKSKANINIKYFFVFPKQVEPLTLHLTRCSNSYNRYCHYHDWEWWRSNYWQCNNFYLQPTIPIRESIYAKVDVALPVSFLADQCSVQLKGTSRHSVTVNPKCSNRVAEISQESSLFVILTVKSNSLFWNNASHVIKVSMILKF